MIYRAKNYAHDSYQRSETVEYLMSGNRDDFEGWPEEVAVEFSNNHAPGSEIGYRFEYDSDADKVTITHVYINGQTFEASA